MIGNIIAVLEYAKNNPGLGEAIKDIIFLLGIGVFLVMFLFIFALGIFMSDSE